MTTRTGNWPGLTNGQARELAREFCVAIMNAVEPMELPGDDWLDSRLRDRGCPDDQLATWRERILAMPLRRVSDNAA